ncbi:MAG: ABC transporter ATP-binding protein/permease [Lachnospiraceae bacterium]|nr:ABC transporter ATP-binding protein/permease [Lachnospiraceae bacterium]
MWKYLKKYWFYCLLAPLFMMGELTMDLLQPDMMATIVDDGVLASNMEVILTEGVRMVLLVVFGGTCGVLCGVFANIAAQEFGNDVRKALFSRIMDFSFEQTDHFTTGSLVTRITNDVTQVEQMVMMSVRSLVRCVFMFVGGIYMLYRQSPRFALVAACGLPFVTVIVVVTLKKVSPLYTIIQQKLDRVNSCMQENIAGARVVKAYVKEDYELEHFSGANDSLCDTNLQAQTILAFMNPAVNIILNLCVVGVLYVGGYTVQQDGGITPGQTMAALTYLSLILMRIVFFANIFQTFTRASASWRRIREVLDTPVVQRQAEMQAEGGSDGMQTHAGGASDGEPAHAEKLSDGRFTHAGGNFDDVHIQAESIAAECAAAGTARVQMPAACQSGEIEFRDVSFAFPDAPENLVLDHISFRAKQGETIAVIGSTGSGKTSLVQLIPRFYDATEGKVLVDGQDVRTYSMQTLRDKIGIVQQKTELFSRSIRENILWGSEDRYEEITASAAADRTDHSPKGCSVPDTESGEGQKAVNAGAGENRAVCQAAEAGKISEPTHHAARKMPKVENNPDNQPDPVSHAARIAQAEEFILRTPDGYETQVTEGGHSLSGGQKQRISIARAVIKNPEILIFDDSGSALDLKTEAALYEALNREFADTTRIIVAQRIFSVRDADRILVLDNGRICASGTHEELLQSSDVYREICRSQLKKGEIGA